MFQLTTSDGGLVSGIEIKIDLGKEREPIDGWPDGGSNMIKLQFPAKIKTDSKSARWDQLFDTILYEPGYMFKGGDVRKATLTIMYIVGGPGPKGSWGPVEVANEVRRLKSYFYQGARDFEFLPVYQITLYQNMPKGGGTPGYSSWRGDSISISHGEELITWGGATYPLKTEVSLSLMMTTKIEANDGVKTYPQFSNIADKPQKIWY